MKNKTPYAKIKQGEIEFDGKKIYMRSAWERNYARYLEYLKNKGDILKWEYEVDTFWFEKIKRGVRSYTPDFKVFKADSSFEYHEVKGWMDKKSKTKLKRMAIYYPKITLILIDEKAYRGLAKRVRGMVKGWE